MYVCMLIVVHFVHALHGRKKGRKEGQEGRMKGRTDGRVEKQALMCVYTNKYVYRCRVYVYVCVDGRKEYCGEQSVILGNKV